jgi:uncharacterized membrane protein
MPPRNQKDRGQPIRWTPKLSNVLRVADREETQSRTHIGERLSEVIARFCGTMTFVWIHVGWFGGWVVNTAMDFGSTHSLYVSYFVVSLEAIFRPLF